jgi:hypothetical protein
MDGRAVGRADFVLRTVAAEHQTDGVRGVDVRPDGLDADVGARHDRDVNSALVVAVDEHRVTVEVVQEFVVEADQ